MLHHLKVYSLEQVMWQELTIPFCERTLLNLVGKLYLVNYCIRGETNREILKPKETCHALELKTCCRPVMKTEELLQGFSACRYFSSGLVNTMESITSGSGCLVTATTSDLPHESLSVH